MTSCIGIRREDKNRWERRTPLTPAHIKELKESHNIEVAVQPSDIRAFSGEDYEEAGASMDDALSSCQTIFAIKEIPIELLEEGKTYVFFAHVIKGQEHNMPLLKKMMELKCNLIDYERIVNDKGLRMIAFGKWAGLAGMTDTLAFFGKRLTSQGIANPFDTLKPAHEYRDTEGLTADVSKVGESIRENGLPRELVPMVVGLAGYGNVSGGCQEVLDHLPLEVIEPEQLADFMEKGEFSDKKVYKVVFKEWHMVESISTENEFELQDYYQHPEKYRGIFPKHLPHLTILMNCIYWNTMYPRLITKELAKDMYGGDQAPKLRAIGDISCDIDGAVEFTSKSTDIDNPTFVYDPIEDKLIDGVEGRGFLVMAVDNLPCELPRESSKQFGDTLMEFVPAIAKADFSRPFNEMELPPPIRKAVILYHGKLRPDYEYLNKFL